MLSVHTTPTYLPKNIMDEVKSKIKNGSIREAFKTEEATIDYRSIFNGIVWIGLLPSTNTNVIRSMLGSK